MFINCRSPSRWRAESRKSMKYKIPGWKIQFMEKQKRLLWIGNTGEDGSVDWYSSFMLFLAKKGTVGTEMNLFFRLKDGSWTLRHKQVTLGWNSRLKLHNHVLMYSICAVKGNKMYSKWSKTTLYLLGAWWGRFYTCFLFIIKLGGKKMLSSTLFFYLFIYLFLWGFCQLDSISMFHKCY